MEKSPFALSVDNSLLDSIHPLANSNRGKFPATLARRTSARIVSTNKPANTHGRAATCTCPLVGVFVRALIRALEINPTPEGRAGPAGVFV
jgi:hypothetical protein